MPGKTLVGAASQGITVAAVFDGDRDLSLAGQRNLPLSRPQGDAVLARRQFDAQDLDLVGQQRPAAGVGGFGRFPNDSGGVHRQAGPNVQTVDLLFHGIDGGLLDRPPGDGPRQDVRVDGLVLLDRQLAHIRDRLRRADRPAVDVSPKCDPADSPR